MHGSRTLPRSHGWEQGSGASLSHYTDICRGALSFHREVEPPPTPSLGGRYRHLAPLAGAAAAAEQTSSSVLPPPTPALGGRDGHLTPPAGAAAAAEAATAADRRQGQPQGGSRRPTAASSSPRQREAAPDGGSQQQPAAATGQRPAAISNDGRQQRPQTAASNTLDHLLHFFDSLLFRKENKQVVLSL